MTGQIIIMQYDSIMSWYLVYRGIGGMLGIGPDNAVLVPSNT